MVSVDGALQRGDGVCEHMQIQTMTLLQTDSVSLTVLCVNLLELVLTWVEALLPTSATTLGKTKPAYKLEREAVQHSGKHCSVFDSGLHAQFAAWSSGRLSDNEP